jgi:hypothetical protein
MSPRKKRNFKLTIREHNMIPEDKQKVIKGYKHVDELRSIAKKVKDKAILNLLQEEISDVRKYLLGEYASKFYKATISLGPHKKEQFFAYYPSVDELNYLKNDLVESLSKDRKDRKVIRTTVREFNGMRYVMNGNREYEDLDDRPRMPRIAPTRVGTVEYATEPTKTQAPKKENKILPTLKGNGRVFSEPGSILKLVDSEEYANRITRPKRPYDKSNYVGVELELICKVDRQRLNDLFVKHKLAGLVYVKYDGSIQVENGGEQTHEVTIIGKQEMINDVVNRVCKVLNDEKVGAYVNNSCGLHVHLDMRKRDHKLCYLNLYKALPVLAAMVPINRTQNNIYCMLNRSGEFDNIEKMDRTTRRRQAINPVAFDDHGTIEVRLHSGSLNATKINNWINILTAIVDKKEVATTSERISTPEDMRLAFGISESLVAYIKQRTEKFAKQASVKMDHTKADHLDNAI